jgi:NAD(P)-dependent dehydrogenase (short-subunit alcohol dehydrogenase family)
MLLERKTAIVTGAASPRGIGKASAQLFAEHSARVAIVDLAPADPQAAAADLGPEHRGYACDVIAEKADDLIRAASRRRTKARRRRGGVAGGYRVTPAARGSARRSRSG